MYTIDICLMDFSGRDFLLPVVVNGHGSKVQVGRSQLIIAVFDIKCIYHSCIISGNVQHGYHHVYLDGRG